jgi:hypothetical protein
VLVPDAIFAGAECLFHCLYRTPRPLPRDPGYLPLCHHGPLPVPVVWAVHLQPVPMPLPVSGCRGSACACACACADCRCLCVLMLIACPCHFRCRFWDLRGRAVPVSVSVPQMLMRSVGLPLLPVNVRSAAVASCQRLWLCALPLVPVSAPNA